MHNRSVSSPAGPDDAPTGRLTRIGAPAAPRPWRPRTSTLVLLVLVSSMSGAGLRLFQEWDERRQADILRCWDGSVPGKDAGCEVGEVGAQFWAFGLEEGQCRADPDYGDEHNTTSFECTVGGVAVHVAAYESFDARARRLGKYGPRTDLGGGRVFAGGTDQLARRSIRTYDGPSAQQGLLMYASVDATVPGAEDVLNGLAQRTAEVMLRGSPD